jgi:transposase
MITITMLVNNAGIASVAPLLSAHVETMDDMIALNITALTRLTYGISPSQLFRWRRFRDEGTLTSLGAGEAVVPESELKSLQAQVRELQRLLGKKTLENETLREALELARQKKLLSRALLPPKDDSR